MIMAHEGCITRVGKPRNVRPPVRHRRVATRRSVTISYMADADDPVTLARRALDRAEKVAETRREELADAITEAVRGGEMLSKVAARAKYTREHVRRLVRARGVEPRDPERQPPPVRRKTAREMMQTAKKPTAPGGPYSDLFSD